MEAQDDSQSGERVTVKVLDPVKPSQKEIDEHEPYAPSFPQLVPRVCARAGCGYAAPCQDWR